MANRRANAQTVHYDGPAGGLGVAEGDRADLRRGMADAGGDRNAGAPEQAARLHVHIVLLGEARRLSPVRILRERRQGHPLGADDPPLHAGILRQTHGDRAQGLQGLRPRTGRPADPSDALRRRYGPLRSVRLGRGVCRDRRRAQDARSEVRDLLRVRPRQPRDVVSLRPVCAPVRQQQPARQLQHVPRDDLGRAEEGRSAWGSGRSSTTT